MSRSATKAAKSSAATWRKRDRKVRNEDRERARANRERKAANAAVAEPVAEEAA